MNDGVGVGGLRRDETDAVWKNAERCCTVETTVRCTRCSEIIWDRSETVPAESLSETP